MPVTSINHAQAIISPPLLSEQTNSSSNYLLPVSSSTPTPVCELISSQAVVNYFLSFVDFDNYRQATLNLKIFNVFIRRAADETQVQSSSNSSGRIRIRIQHIISLPRDRLTAPSIVTRTIVNLLP
jgi:hypothetical protein